jgi:hypothetical protein
LLPRKRQMARPKRKDNDGGDNVRIEELKCHNAPDLSLRCAYSQLGRQTGARQRVQQAALNAAGFGGDERLELGTGDGLSHVDSSPAEKTAHGQRSCECLFRSLAARG